MGKKTKLPFFSKNNNGGQAKPSWRWPSCHQPRTHSFKTDETHESWFSNSSESASFSTASDESGTGVDTIETVIRGLRLRSERLFFEPGETCSILEEAKLGTDNELPFKETTVLSMESLHPFVDFRESMEEMVEAHGLKDWESLEELLGWYLKANGESSHGYILGAFIDLLLKLANGDHSPSSPLSFYTSSSSLSSSSSSEDTSTAALCESSLKAEEELDDDNNNNNNNNNNTYCLSSLSEKKIKDKDDDSSSLS